MIIALEALGLGPTSWWPKTIEGRITDCSNSGLANVEVKVWERGWGIDNGQLVWDKDYIYSGTSDSNGYFSVVYKRGGIDAKLVVRKDGYYDSETFVNFWDDPSIRILRKNPDIQSALSAVVNDCVEPQQF